MANITIDVQAKVVGYEQSIRALQSALAKVDPGSDIGKSISKAMSQASDQVKSLSKNMFPKASSDSQIDSIIEKANRAGEAIQHVATLLQSVQISDLNLGAFGGDIETFKNQIASLQTELDSKLSAGIVKAVSDSEQLKKVFEGLGTDLSKATGATLLEDLSKGAQKAAADVESLEKKLEATKTSISNYETIDSTLKASRLGTLEGRTALDDELKTITSSYDAVFEQLKTTISLGLSKLKTDTHIDTSGLLKTFFSDLTPENVQSHIQSLFETLSAQGIFGENEKRKFYEAIFGSNDQYNTNNINLLTKSIGLDKAYEQYKIQLQEFYQKIVNDIDGKDQAQIGRLINEDQLEKAVSATTKALDSAYNKIFNSIKQNQERLNGALSDREGITLQLNAAQQTRDTFSSAEQQLRQEIEAVRQENKNLENQISQLREQLNQRLSGEVSNIRNTGTYENQNIGNGLRESLEISEAYKNQLAEVAAKEQALGKLQGVVQRWFSIYAAIRMVRQAIDSVISTIKELDATITEIAIVTSMDQSELWDQMPKYTQLARDYAASISGVYQVSQLYYQQGLQTADVMALTEQTLKMARISGLDYAQATDYMTNAIRSFKMEMTDAQQVVDVYSAIAASSATSVTELASAMSKTASSAQAVGSSFKNTTAMMAVMIEATRESAENIGSAMKSIISRYGEMTSDPSKLMDSEGEEMSLNRVDKALQTVGISIHNTAGEFRNFDEVIMELAQKWDTIDTNTQRYIATIMAGNRQQSRFLALVSSYDRLKELSAEAADSEDASQLQFLKTLDSVEAKTQQFQTSVQALYVNSGIEDLYKGALDWTNQVITSLDQLSDKFGTLAVVGKIGATFTTMATLVTNIFNTIKMSYSNTRAKIAAEGKIAAAEEILNQQRVGNETANINNQKVINAQETQQKITQIELDEIAKRKAAEEQHLREINKQNASKTKMRTTGGMIASAAGLAATTWAASVDVNENRGLKTGLTAAGGILSGVGTGLMIGGAPGAIIGALTALPSILEAIGMASESTAERLSRLQKTITDTSNTKLEARSQLRTLTDYKTKFDELSAAQFESAEAKEQFIKLQNDIAASYPELISGMDTEGNYVVNMTDAYKELAAAKASAYKDSFISNLGAELAGLNDLSYVVKNTYGKEPLKESGVNFWRAAAGIVPSGGNSQIQDYIINMASGKNHDLNVLTLRDLITNGQAESFIHSATYQNDNTGDFGPILTTIESISPENIQVINKVVTALATLAKSDNPLTFQEAQAQLSEQYKGQDNYQRVINNIDETIGQYLFTAARAADFQDLLIGSKINSSNAEYMKILQTEAEALGDSRFIANDLQQYGIQQKLNTDLKAYLDANRKRIGTEKYKDANGKDQDVDEKRLIEEFYTGLNGQSAKDLIYYNEQLQQLMSDGINNQANEIYKNLGKYSKNYINTSGLSEEAQELLLNALNEQYKNIFTDYTNWVSNTDFQDEEIKDSLQKYSDSFSAETLQAIQKQYSGILNNEFLDDIQRNTQLSNLTKIYDEVAKISDSDYTAGQTLLATVQKADLTSLQGINSVVEAINKLNLGPLGNTLSNLLIGIKDNLTANLTTEFTQLGEKLTSNMSDFEKAVSNSTKGMDLKTATQMAEKLGKGLGDFQVLNGKFYYDNYEDIEKAYLDADQALIDDLKERKDLIISASKQLTLPQIETEIFNIEELDSSMGIDEDYLSRWASKFEELGLSVSDVLNYALGNFDETIMTDEDLNKLKNLEMPTLTSLSLPIDQLIESTNNIEDIFSIIDAYDFSSIEGLNAGSLKNYVTLFMNRTGEDLDLSFSAWLEKYLNDLYESNITKINEYKTYQTASTYLLAGDIEHFLSTAGVAFSENLKNQIISGDISNLPQQLQQFATLIYDTYHSINESIANSMISAIGDGEGLIKVTDTNKEALEKIQSEHADWLSGNITVGSQVTIAAENLLDSAQTFEQFIVSSFDTNADRIKALTDIHKNQYANSRVENYGKIAGEETFAYEDLLNYINKAYGFGFLDEISIEDKMTELGLAFDSMGNVIIENYDLWIAELESEAEILASNGANQQELNHAQALLEKTKHTQEQAIASGFDGILKDYSNISIESVEALANALGVSYEYILSYLTSNGNGTYQLDTSKLSALLSELNGKVSQATIEAIEKSISSIGDAYLSNIKNATSYTTKGASSLADVEAFRQSYTDITGQVLDESAFQYNKLTQSFMLDPAAMQKYVDAQKEILIGMGYTVEFVNAYITDQTDKAIQASIELDSFLNADTNKSRNDEANKLFQQIRGLSNYQEISRSAIRTLYPEYGMGLQAAMADIEKESFKAIMTVLESGGQDAVNLLKQIKPDASSDELEAAFNSQINKLTDVLGQVGDLVAGEFVGTEGKLYEVLARAGAVDDNGVVKAGFNMVEVYAAIYAEMSNTAGATTAGLNDAYAKLLTARAQSNINLKDALSNAGGMSPDDFAKLMSSYNLNMEEVLHDNVTNVIVDQFGNILIKDFQSFSNYMNEHTNANWNPNDPALKEVYSAYADAKVAIMNQSIEDTKTVTEQLSSVLEAKSGQAVNISYLGLEDLFDHNEAALNAYLTNFGAAYEDGILKIGNQAAIPSLIHDIGEKAKKAGKIIPEQLAELEDSIVAILDNIISLLSNGISGNLNNKDLITVTNWYTSLAKQYPDLAQSLDVINTSDGLKIVESSLANIYELLKRINAEKADAFLDEIIDSKESYQTLTGSLNEFNDARQQEIKQSEKVRQAYDNLNSVTSKAIQQGTVTSDYYSRPHVLDDEGNIKTYYSSTYSSGDNKRHVIVTPILPDGTELSQATLDKYAWGFANKEIDLKTKIVDENGKELKYAFEDIYMGTYDTVKAAKAAAEAYHKYHEAILEVTDALDGMNGTLGKTSNMLRDIVQKNMVNPDSMNFMSNKLPDHFQTAVNAWENTSKAINTLTKAEKKGYIGVQDFYNIVQTASSLMEAAGKEFEVAGMNAAQLMQAGAENVKVVDGKLTVDLSSAGMDIIGSVGDLKQNMADGIHELADAEIAIIDAEIQVLEILAAMEQLGDIDVDVDQNGINFEVGDIFDPNGPNGFSQQMYDYTQSLLGLCATSKELEEALKQVKINGESLYSLLNADADTWTKTFGSEENVSKFWQNFSKGIEGWDLQGNLQEQVLNFFKGLDSELNIDLGENGLFHLGVNGSVYQVDFSNEQLMSDAEKVAKQVGIDTKNNLPDKIKEIFNKKPQEISIEENLLLKVASGIITTEYAEDGKTITGYKVGGKTYTDQNIAAAVGDLIQAGAKINEWPDAEATYTKPIKGKITIGSTDVEVLSKGQGMQYFNEAVNNGQLYDDIDTFFDDWFKQDQKDKNKPVDHGSVDYKTWKVKKGFSVEPVFEVNGKEGNINKSTDLRDAVKDYLDTGTTEDIEVGDKAATVTLKGGIKATIPNDQLEFEIDESGNPQVTADSLKSYFNNLVGLDLGLKDTISSAIKDALSGITEQLNSLDPGKLSEVASVLAEIAAALADIASQDIEKQIEQIKELQSAAENQGTELNIPENIDESEFESALTRIIHEAAEAVANDNTFKEITGKIGESGGQTLVDKFGKELSNMAEQVQPQLTAAASSLSSKASIMGEAGKQLGEAIVKGIQEGMTGNVQTISSAIDAIASSIKTSLIPVLTQVKDLSKQEFNFDLGPDTENTAEVVATILETLGGITELRTQTIRIQAPGVDGVKNKLEALLSVLDAIAEKASIMINAEVGTASETPEEPPKEDITTVPVKYEQKGEKLEPPEGTEVDYIINVIQNGEITHIFDEMADYIIDIIQNGSIPSLHDQHATYTIDYVVRGGAVNRIGATIPLPKATGNVGLAKARGTQTLMGELGPELVVSNGRYFVAGQNGAEMVNLADDAIVFNHLQTEQLLKNGMSKGRGRAVTNERNAVAFATGNVEGPAMASASAALNALKQLRAMWESLKSASISDLAGAGGGGGGGGGGDNAKIVNPSIWVDTVERWYNLMQKIAKLEKEITHEEKLRSKLSSDWTANGNHYYASQKRSLEALRDQIDAQEQLNLSREAYYDQRVDALKNQPFGQLIEFDNEGQMRFKEGAMDWLTNLVGFDQNGKANYTDEEKYNILMAAGYGDYMKYDSSGGEIKMDDDNDGEVTDEERQSFYGNATKAFWDKINDYKDATQSLWDSIKEGEDSILQLQADQNELLADIRENQMAVEDAVLDAIEDMRQREIDALQDERDKLEESTQKYIDGLSDALNREQEMYQNQEDENSLNQQKRRLAILQRSGGSAEDIANLRAEIDSSERERYFNLQQQQIDAIQRASDLEIERMDSQIELMTETLEYQKEYGLLWGNVYEVMEGTAAQITSFIIHGNSEFWALSPLGTSDQANQTLFKAEQWSSYRKDLNDAKEKIGENEVTAKDIRDNMALMVTMTRRQLADTDYTIFDEAMKAEFGEDYDPNSAYKQLFYDDYMGHGDVTRATATARAKYAADKKAAEDAAAAAQAAAAVPAAEEPHGGEPEEDKGCPDCAVNCGGACYNACQNHCAQGCKGGCKGGCKDTCTNSCTGGPMSRTGYTGADLNKIGGTPTKHAAAGGYVNHGIYELGERGTETVLTASQTKILRDNILSNRPNSLISLLKSYNEGYDGINNSVSGVTPVEDNSTVIEKVELNMEVKQIANDYDARRAGEQALNEMMRIARKTGAANSIRR